MKDKWKFILMCCLMAAVIFLEPVSYALAEETSGAEDGIDRTKSVPRVNSSNVEFKLKELFDLFGLLDVPEENIIKDFVLTHNKIETIDYSLYDLVCDFELKTMGEDGTVTTSNYSYTIDFYYSDVAWSGEHITVEDNLVYSHCDKSNGSYVFTHEFIYRNILKNADGFQEKVVDWRESHTYNTIVSKADFYFVRESDGKLGQACSYIFTWDSDFWLQKCVGISFVSYNPNTGNGNIVEEIENENGVYATLENYESVWTTLFNMIVDAPMILTAFFVGFTELVPSVIELFQVTFPFFPANLIEIFGGLIFIFIFFVALKFVLSFFG